MRRLFAILGLILGLLASSRGADFPATVQAENYSGRLLSPGHFFDTNVQAGSNIAIQHFANGHIVIDATAAPVNVSNLQIGSTVLTNLANLGVTNFQAGAGIAMAVVNGTLWVTNLWSTNGFVTATITNGLASILFVETATNGFVGMAITNGLASILYVQAITNGFVGAGITNGLASLAYVNNATNGFVGTEITNGLASIAYVNTSDITTSNGLVALMVSYDATGSNALRTLLLNNDIITSNGLVTLLVANDAVGSNALRTLLFNSDITTSNGLVNLLTNRIADSNANYVRIINGGSDGQSATNILVYSFQASPADQLYHLAWSGGGGTGDIPILGVADAQTSRDFGYDPGNFWYDIGPEILHAPNVTALEMLTDDLSASAAVSAATFVLDDGGVLLASGGGSSGIIDLGSSSAVSTIRIWDGTAGHYLQYTDSELSDSTGTLTVDAGTDLVIDGGFEALSGIGVSGISIFSGAVKYTLPAAGKLAAFNSAGYLTNSDFADADIAGKQNGTATGTNLVAAGFTNFNANQFAISAGLVSLTNNAKATNLDLYAGVTLQSATASRAAVFDANRRLTNSTVTDTELGYLSGATSSLQTQINSLSANLLTNGSMLQTNFVLNTAYTNANAGPILVRASAYLVPALVNGTASLDLMAAYGGGSYSLVARSAMATLLTGGIALPMTNAIVAVLTNSASYYFTNTSSGAGDSSGIVAGSGQVVVIGGAIPPTPGMWPGGAGGNSALTANIYKYAQASGQNQAVTGSTNTAVNQVLPLNFTCTGLSFNTTTITLGTGTNLTVAFQTNGVDAFTATLTGNGTRKACFAFAKSISVTTNDNFNIRWAADGAVAAQNYSSGISFTIP